MNTTRELSKTERQRRAVQRAMGIAKFCKLFDIGRTKTYEEIKAGRLRARKIGARTIITDWDAEDWLHSLPIVMPDSAHKGDAS